VVVEAEVEDLVAPVEQVDLVEVVLDQTALLLVVMEQSALVVAVVEDATILRFGKVLDLVVLVLLSSRILNHK
tara:strand:- start:49 stop:267 length:219 start_codon:yes stop_codon:yes gene_type:complete